MLKLQLGMPPTSSMDFDFNDARPMPFLSAPSTPRRFGDFSFSAPSSPSRMTEFYSSFHDYDQDGSRSHGGGGDSRAETSSGGDDFAFDFRSDLEENSLYAEELFDGGKIKLLKPEDKISRGLSPIAKGQKIIRDVFSPRKKKDYSDEETGNERGRERGLTSNSSRRAARSLSPHRVSEYPWEEEEEEEERKSQESTKRQSATAHNNSKTPKSSSRKWRLKDFLLFRSASEGRASDKHYKYYPSFFRKHEDHAKNSSPRGTDSGTGSGAGTRRKGQVSAHELHYKTNKAAKEDLKKKTYLPYKQAILGRFAFSPTPHTLVNGVGSPHH